jgi:hypothetical protein
LNTKYSFRQLEITHIIDTQYFAYSKFGEQRYFFKRIRSNKFIGFFCVLDGKTLN